MPPHLRPFHFLCDEIYCARKAVHQLFNERNALVGKYCGPCGERRLNEALKRFIDGLEKAPDAAV